MTSLTPARTESELLEVNRHFYNALWSDARLIEPERFNTWPLVCSLLAPAQRRLGDDAEIVAFGGPRNVVPDSPARTGNVDLQPRDDAPGRALSKTAGAGTGPDRHRRRRGSPAAVPARKRLERDVVFHVVELARRFLGGLALARGGGLFRFPGTRVARPLPAAEHLHAVGDDFGGRAFLPLFVLPLARAQGSLDIDLRALLEILAGDFRDPCARASGRTKRRSE